MKQSKALSGARAGVLRRSQASRGRALVAVVALLASMLTGAMMSPASASAGIVVDFESGDTSGWALGGSADFGGVTSSETSTVPSGAGAPSGSTKSATVTKVFGNAFWGGTSFLLPVANASNLLSAGNKTASMKVYSPVAGQTVRLKLETQGNPGQSVEVNASATTVVGWQTLNFDFATEAAGTAAWNAGYTYNVASVFFDFSGNDATVVGGTYYFDDVAFPGAVVAAPPAPVVSGGITVDFEAGDTSGWALGGAQDFGGVGSSETTTVPAGAGAPSGSTKSAFAVKPVTAEVWGGTTFLGAVANATSLISADTLTASALVYSPTAGQTVRLKLEDSANNAHYVEADATTVAGWQTLTFNFAAPASTPFNASYTYNRASIFFNFLAAGAGETYYFDNVAFPGAVVAAPPAPVVSGVTVDFEAGDTSGWALGGAQDFGGVGSSETTTIPAGAGAPSGSTKSAFVVKPVTAEVWGGTTFLGDVANATSLLSADTLTASVLVYSPAAGQTVRLKLEDAANNAHYVEADATTVVGWQTLTFNFAAPASTPFNAAYTYDRASIFFNFLAAGAGETYYFDNANFPGAVVASPPPPPATGGLTVNFEPSDTSGWALGGAADFGGVGSSETTTVPGGAGAPAGSTKSATVTKVFGNAFWAGTTFLKPVANATNLLSAGNKTASMKVYSPVAGQVVRLKLETNGNPGQSVEVNASATTVVGWQTMNFDFATQAAGTAAWNAGYVYDVASVFFDFSGSDGSVVGGTYYFDDVTFPGAVGVSPPPSANAPAMLVTFETSDTSSYSLGGGADFGGTLSSLSSTPPSGGSAGSLRSGQVVKTTGAQTWAGTTFLNTSAGTLTLADAAHKVVTANVYSPVAGRVVRLKLEDAGNGAHSVEADATTPTTVGWQTLTFNLNTQATGTAAFDASYTYNVASIFFSFGVSPAADETYYLDDVAFNGAVTPAVAPTPRAYPFTVTAAASVTNPFTASVTATKVAAPGGFALVSAPDAGFGGPVDAHHGGYLTISGGTFLAGGTNVTVNAARTRAELTAAGAAASVGVLVPDTSTITVKFYVWTEVTGVVTETLTQTIAITGIVSPTVVVSNGIVSPKNSWTLLRSHWTGWDPAQKIDDKVIMGLSGSDWPAYIEGHIYDTIGETMTNQRVTVATTGPIVVGINQYEAPGASRTGGVSNYRAITSETLTASNAFIVQVRGDGTGNSGVGTITISVNGTVIGTKTVTITGPVTGIKATVNNPVIAVTPTSGFTAPAKPAKMYTSVGVGAYATAISFVAADANGSISYDAYEAMTVSTSDTSVATAQLAADEYGNRFVAVTGLKAGKVDVTITNAAGKKFPAGSITVVAPVIATLALTPAKASFSVGESATVTMTAKTADGTTIPDGTYTLSNGMWSANQSFFPSVSGTATFVDGVATFQVWVPLTAGPFIMESALAANGVIAPALQGTTASVTLTVAPLSNTSAAVTLLSSSIQSLMAQVAAMSATFSANLRLLTTRIKAAYAALAKLKAKAKR